MRARTYPTRGPGYCMDPPTTTVVEVVGSHMGLVWSPAAYRALGQHLRRTNMRAGSVHGTPAHYDLIPA